MRFKALIPVLLLILMTACQDKTRVGEGLEDFREQEQARQLGEIMASPEPDGSPTAGAIGADPRKSPSPSPAQPTQTIEVALIHDNPYFEVDGRPTNDITVSAGTIIKVVSRDPERPRQFAADNGAFASPDLNEGQTWEYRATMKGEFRLTDKNVPFVFGYLRVV